MEDAGLAGPEGLPRHQPQVPRRRGRQQASCTLPIFRGQLGRDHNPFVFTNWLAGGGVRGGVTYGESDEWSYKPLDRDRPTYCYDVHATILHLLGIDHEQLTYRSNGIDRLLTDVHGRVIREVIG